MAFDHLAPLKIYLARHRRQILLGFVCLVVTDILALAWPFILKLAVDSLEAGASQTRLLLYAGLFFGITAVEGFFRYGMRWILIGVSRRVEYAFRNDFFWHLLTLSRSFYHKTRTGDLLARASNDLDAVRNMLGPGIMYFASTAVTVLVAFVLMFYFSWQLTLAAMIPLPLLSYGVYKISRRVHHYSQKIQEQYATLANMVQENLSGVRVVKAYVQEPHEIGRFRGLNFEFIRRNLRLAKLSALSYPALSSVGGLTMATIIWYGGRRVIAGQLTLGTFVAFTGYLLILIWPMIALGWVIGLYQMGTASLKRIQEIMRTRPEVVSSNGPATVDGRLRGAIAFRNLSFGYAGENHLVLKRVDLEIPPGTTCAIVGATGSGKSTLVNLLPRFFPVKDGQIFVDGGDINQISLDRLRQGIGFVPQEPFLFSDTIAANVAFGSEKVDLEQIKLACEIADFDKDVAGFPKGYDTMIGERGITLSGGQRQRLAIARAVALDPAILILDDAFSSVDTDTEENILKRLRQFGRNRTVILISHRTSTVKDADMIVVLQDGEIGEQGTHEELLVRDGTYAELYRKQLLEEELERI